MSGVSFTVPGEPMSKARARVVNGHAYTPAATRIAETAVLSAYLMNPQRGRTLTGPVRLEVVFHCATKVRRDLDNMFKLVADALNGHAWVDDWQIQEIAARRHMVGKGEARTVVQITSLGLGTP